MTVSWATASACSPKGPLPVAQEAPGFKGFYLLADRQSGTIVSMALRLFETQGFEHTTVEQIAGAAETSSTTFYRYFPTKEDVPPMGSRTRRHPARHPRRPGPQHRRTPAGRTRTSRPGALRRGRRS